MKPNRLFLILGFAIAFGAITTSAADQKTQDLYKTKCQGCHGPTGKATAMGKKLGAKDFQEVASATKEDWVKIITDGKGKMPAYKGKLSDEQISDLASYIKEMK